MSERTRAKLMQLLTLGVSAAAIIGAASHGIKAREPRNAHESQLPSACAGLVRALDSQAAPSGAPRSCVLADIVFRSTRRGAIAADWPRAATAKVVDGGYTSGGLPIASAYFRQGAPAVPATWSGP